MIDATKCARSVAIRPGRPGGARRWLLTALALSLVGGLAAACGGGSGSGNGKTTITFTSWAYAESTTKTQLAAAAKGFEASHPKIKVELRGIGFTDIAHQLLLQAQARKLPDVVQTTGNDMLTEAEAKILRPLDSYADASYRDKILPASLKLNEVDGKLVAAPWVVAPFGFWYNKKVMAQAGLDPNHPPTSTDELLDDLAAVKAKVPGTIPLGLDATDRSFGLDVNWPIMQSFGARPFKGKEATADTPEMRTYLTFMRTLAKKGYTQVNKQLGDFRPIAAQNKVAFMFDGLYLQSIIQGTNHMTNQQFFDTWGATKLPAGPTGNSYSIPSDGALAVTSASSHPKEAWEFIRYLSTAVDGPAFKFIAAGGISPLRKVTGPNAAQANTPILNAFRDIVEPTVIRPDWGSTYAKVYSPVMSSVGTAMTSSTSIAKIAKEMQSQVRSAA